MNATNKSTLSEAEKSDLCSDIANVADTLKGIERVLLEGGEDAVLLLVSGLGIHAKTLYSISRRFLEVSEIKEGAQV